MTDMLQLKNNSFSILVEVGAIFWFHEGVHLDKVAVKIEVCDIKSDVHTCSSEITVR